MNFISLNSAEFSLFKNIEISLYLRKDDFLKNKNVNGCEKLFELRARAVFIFCEKNFVQNSALIMHFYFNPY